MSWLRILVKWDRWDRWDMLRISVEWERGDRFHDNCDVSNS